MCVCVCEYWDAFEGGSGWIVIATVFEYNYIWPVHVDALWLQSAFYNMASVAITTFLSANKYRVYTLSSIGDYPA